MQHFRVKVFAKTFPGFDLAQAIPMFHRWIQKKTLPDLLIDVADYRHVPSGPGVLLVGHDAHYGFDQSKQRLGLSYTRRTVANGSSKERLEQALDAAETACKLIEREPEFAGKIEFPAGELEISVNDRLLAPNTAQTWIALEPDLRATLDARWGAGSYVVERTGEPRELFTVSARRSN